MEIVLTFARTNDAIHAEHVLLRAGLPVQVMPLPSAIRAGCGICLRLPQLRFNEAAALLQTAKIPVESVHARTVSAGRSEYTPYRGNTND